MTHFQVRGQITLSDGKVERWWPQHYGKQRMYNVTAHTTVGGAG